MSAENTKNYPDAPTNPEYPKIEEEILAHWQSEDVFRETIKNREGEKEFVFYDGPPFANGLPHYGHLVTGYVKDLIPRYKTMQGFKVDRRFGWDTHGLPAELQTEKEIGISGRKEILDYGIDKYNAACQKSVLQFTKDWEYYVNRQGRWVDFENDYKTLDVTYMESVMWAFKELWDKGLIYEDYRVVPYSWAVESPLSNFETRLDNSYRMRQDPAVTIAFELDEKIDGKTAYMLAWTTTPWTLPSNLALAVGPDIEYAFIEHEGEIVIMAKDRLQAYAKEFASHPPAPDGAGPSLSKGRREKASPRGEAGSQSEPGEGILKVVKGRELEGLSYKPLFPYFADRKNDGKTFKVLLADFVTDTDGTGIAHEAPGFGEEDLVLCRGYGIEIVVPIDNQGKFTSEVPDFEGLLWRDANKLVIQKLKDEKKLVRHETIDHNYPHCWRTDEPLIYKAINSWYLEVSKFRDRMAALNRENINWVPHHVRDGQFGKWLEGARDWNIARNRFWGAPIPVWKSDNPEYPRIDVYGSIEEMERDFGVKIDNLHRPYIDDLTRPNPDDPTGKSKMVRVEDVLDCWFESGSMPFAQVHYPFKNKDWFETHFPGDFIVEYIAQTRGWFYTLMVLSTALFDKAPFRNCICHGVVLDENHQKLSKRLKNYPDPIEVFNTYGSDALRWYLVSTPLMTGGDLSIPKDGKAIGQTRNAIVNPVWNAYSFFTLYANADHAKGNIIQDAESVLDRYILAKTRELIETVETKLDAYDIPAACNAIQLFMDALNNWYIRRARDRFWRAEKDADKQAAYDTLYTVLHNLARVAAPFLPFITDKIYSGLTGEKSVHLAGWPDASMLPEDKELVSAMDRTREVCSAALSVRELEGLRVRLPLAEMIVASEDASRLNDYADLIQDELNVKILTLTDNLSEYGTLELKVNPAIGKRVGAKMKDIMPAAKSGDWSDNGDGTVTIAGEILNEDEFSMRLVTAGGLAAQQLSGQGAVILDTKLTPELEREGLARDLIRLIQQTRKDADFHISDRIDLSLELPVTMQEAVNQHSEFIKAETLANALTLGIPKDAAYVGAHEVAGENVKIAITRAKEAA